MKVEDFKNMVREIIREELSTVMKEQAHQWWLKPAEAELDAHLYPSQVHEEKYDADKDLRAMGFRSWDDYYRTYPEMDPNAPERPKSTEPFVPNPRFSQKPYVMPPDAKTLGPMPGYATDRKNMLHQKIKYKNTDGSEGEGFVYSLLKYDKNHPGYKAAARIYAQFMAKNKDRAPKEEQLCEGEGCLDEKSVPEPYNRKSPPRRKMSKAQIEKRRRIGRDMLASEKTTARFRKKYGDDWKSYLWAAASAATFKTSSKKK
jgi:hypothetical protein